MESHGTGPGSHRASRHDEGHENESKSKVVRPSVVSITGAACAVGVRCRCSVVVVEEPCNSSLIYDPCFEVFHIARQFAENNDVEGRRKESARRSASRSARQKAASCHQAPQISPNQMPRARTIEASVLFFHRYAIPPYRLEAAHILQDFAERLSSCHANISRPHPHNSPA